MDGGLVWFSRDYHKNDVAAETVVRKLSKATFLSQGQLAIPLLDSLHLKSYFLYIIPTVLCHCTLRLKFVIKMCSNLSGLPQDRLRALLCFSPPFYVQRESGDVEFWDISCHFRRLAIGYNITLSQKEPFWWAKSGVTTANYWLLVTTSGSYFSRMESVSEYEKKISGNPTTPLS